MYESRASPFNADQKVHTEELNSGQRLSGNEMAQQGILSNQEKHCSVCFDRPTDPLTVPCGHSYCMRCVKSCRDEENQKETHSCPQCGQDFTTKPGPVEKPKTGCQAAPGPADVACDVTAAVSGKPQESLNEDQTKMLPTETEVDTLQPEDEPKTRAEFLKYSCELTLDPNTASECLLLSEGNRKATRMEEDQVYPSHPDRFVTGSLVLSKECLTGRHYWEVERSGPVSVAVTYKDISRTGTESVFGCNYKSWALDCFDHRFVVRHVCITAAKPYPVSSRVGVYLDHMAGILSFYSVSESMSLLHRVQTTFSQPLYAGLWVHGHKSAAVLC